MKDAKTANEFVNELHEAVYDRYLNAFLIRGEQLYKSMECSKELQNQLSTLFEVAIKNSKDNLPEAVVKEVNDTSLEAISDNLVRTMKYLLDNPEPFIFAVTKIIVCNLGESASIEKYNQLSDENTEYPRFTSTQTNSGT